jgi:tetratricopeptide (TPR) repeat protein
MTRKAFLLIAIAAWLRPSAPLAQHADHNQFGTVSFETSCAPAVSGDINRAVAQLHSFEFRMAMDVFNGVLTRDPSCAIAHWGIALGYWGNPFGGIKSGPLIESGRTAIQKGMTTGTPTPRERGYIESVAELFKSTDTASHRQRTLAYASAMDRLQRAFPSDMEAKIFYALAVNQTADPNDKKYTAQLQAASILEPLWQQHPQHPGLPHYIIHAYDSPPLAERALQAARRYATIAPAAPHALHMPSHTFTRVGFWKESVETNIMSEQAAIRDGANGEALHAMDYQIYAYLQMAADDRAREVMQRAPGVASKLNLTAVGGAAPAVAGVYATAAIPARFALERGAWAEAAALAPSSTPFPNADAVTHFARALGAARSGQPAAAARDIEQLATLRDKLGTMNDAYWREQVDIQRRVALAWVAFAEGRRAEAVEQMKAAADAEDATDKAAISPGPLAPARELLGEMLLAAGDSKAALAAFEATIAKEPNRFRGAFGGATAAEKTGSRDVATRHYRQLLTIASGANADRPELRQARAFVGSGR